MGHKFYDLVLSSSRATADKRKQRGWNNADNMLISMFDFLYIYIYIYIYIYYMYYSVYWAINRPSSFFVRPPFEVISHFILVFVNPPFPLKFRFFSDSSLTPSYLSKVTKLFKLNISDFNYFLFESCNLSP